MTDKPTWEQVQRDRDKRVTLPLDLREALDGLLKVDPDAEPEENAPEPANGSTT
jgi:hypothetical protein